MGWLLPKHQHPSSFGPFPAVSSSSVVAGHLGVPAAAVRAAVLSALSGHARRWNEPLNEAGDVEEADACDAEQHPGDDPSDGPRLQFFRLRALL